MERSGSGSGGSAGILHYYIAVNSVESKLVRVRLVSTLTAPSAGAAVLALQPAHRHTVAATPALQATLVELLCAAISTSQDIPATRLALCCRWAACLGVHGRIALPMLLLLPPHAPPPLPVSCHNLMVSLPDGQAPISSTHAPNTDEHLSDVVG